MKIKGRELSKKQILCLAIYYCFLYYLPGTSFPIFGHLFKKLRYYCCRNIFRYCGKNANIERKAFFASGSELILGDYSGLGICCNIPGNTNIGNYVMMGPYCYILGTNHVFNNLETPMMFQGNSERKQTVIEDNVWIGRNVVMTPGRRIKKGSIIGIGCVLTKDFPEFSIIGGNPSRLIKTRKYAE
jgi:maltose O-acetyltransferase